MRVSKTPEEGSIPSTPAKNKKNLKFLFKVFIFIAIFLGKRKGYLLKEEEKDFVIQDVDDILQKILIVYGILALPLLG